MDFCVLQLYLTSQKIFDIFQKIENLKNTFKFEKKQTENISKITENSYTNSVLPKY